MKPGKPLRRRSPDQAKFERQWAKVRLLVLERDGRCMAAEHFPSIACGGGEQVHHKLPRSVSRKDRLNPDLCIAVCGFHHLAIDTNIAYATECGLYERSVA